MFFYLTFYGDYILSVKILVITLYNMKSLNF